MKRLRRSIGISFDKDAILIATKNYDKLWIEFAALKNEDEQCALIYLPFGFNNHYDELHSDEGMDKAVRKYAKLICKYD